MPTNRPVAVTGSTGKLGGRIARRLAEAGVSQRLLARNPDRAPRLAQSVTARADYGDGESVIAALVGIDTALMVPATETIDRLEKHKTFVDAAASAGVGHLVYISSYGAAPDATFTLARDHWATEEHIRAQGMSFTALRDNLYADFMPDLVGADGVIRGPAGDGRVAVVAQDDIADVVAVVLANPGEFIDRTFDLTGPESLTLSDIAATISTVTGKGVSYYPETVREAYQSRSGYGAADWQLDAWVSTYSAIAAGEFAGVSTAIPDITGHSATTLETVLRRLI